MPDYRSMEQPTKEKQNKKTKTPNLEIDLHKQPIYFQKKYKSNSNDIQWAFSKNCIIIDTGYKNKS